MVSGFALPLYLVISVIGVMASHAHAAEAVLLPGGQTLRLHPNQCVSENSHKHDSRHVSMHPHRLPSWPPFPGSSYPAADLLAVYSGLITAPQSMAADTIARLRAAVMCMMLIAPAYDYYNVRFARLPG